MKFFMENNAGSYLLDACFIIALIDNKDFSHKRALEFSLQNHVDYKFFITNYIYLEAATILSEKLDTKIDLSKELNKMGVDILFVSNDIFQQTIKQYASVRNKQVSFIDLLSCLYMKNKLIDGIVTFDAHFNSLSKEYHFKKLN